MLKVSDNREHTTKKNNVLKDISGVILFFVALAMFIPIPSSTEESYETSIRMIIIQIIVFALSRALLWDKKKWWLGLFEVIGFSIISMIYYESLAFNYLH